MLAHFQTVQQHGCFESADVSHEGVFFVSVCYFQVVQPLADEKLVLAPLKWDMSTGCLTTLDIRVS